MQKLSLTLGSDPEFFLMRGGMPYPAIGLVGGNKASPRPTPFGGVQEDNVMLELTHPEIDVYAPNGVDKLVDLLERNIGFANDSIAGSVGLAVDRIRSSYTFDTDLLNSYGGQARVFGCEPDYNAYTGARNPKPSSDSDLRTCGGHIHFGSAELSALDYDSKCEFVQVLEKYVGMHCVNNDPDLTRMSRYGQAGAFRPKSYGVEYRVPSNFWLRDSDSIRAMVAVCKVAYEAWLGGYRVANPAELRQTINELGGVTNA